MLLEVPAASRESCCSHAGSTQGGDSVRTIRSTSFKTGPAESRQIREQLKRVHNAFPNFNAKQLSVVCFVGEGVAERFLKTQRQSN